MIQSSYSTSLVVGDSLNQFQFARDLILFAQRIFCMQRFTRTHRMKFTHVLEQIQPAQIR